MSSHKNQFDVLVIGSGITGLSIAYEAFCRGYSVCVLSKPRNGGATHAAAGMLTPMFEVDSAQDHLMNFCIRGAQLYPEWISGIEKKSGQKCGYVQEGTLLVALYQDHLSELEQMEAFQQGIGLQTKRLSKREVQQKEPALASRQVGALWAKDDHRVEPRLLQENLKKILLTTGVRFFNYDEFELQIEGSQVTLCQVQDEISIQSTTYILAEGVWSGDCYTKIQSILRPVKGQYLLVQGLPDLLNSTIRTPDVYIVPRYNGRYYIGATMEEEGICESRTAGAALDLLYHTWQIFRAVYEMDILEHGVGFRPALLDNQPLYDKSAYDNLYICTGQYRHGVLLAPIGAKFMMDMIEDDSQKNKNPFSLERFRGIL